MGRSRLVALVAAAAAALTAVGTGSVAAAEEGVFAAPSVRPAVKPLGIMAARAAELRSGSGEARASSATQRVTPAATSEGSTFTPQTPVRVLDTRTGTGTPAGPVGPNGTVTLDLSAVVPPSATAVVLNVTGIQPSTSTFITVWPSAAPRPTASNLNLGAGQIRPNAVTVALSPARTINLFNLRGTVHLAADLAGYYAMSTGSRFTSVSPTRVLDTRSGAPVGPRGVVTIDLSSRVPASATAVTFNLTGTGAGTSTFVTAWPAGTARPTASNLNVAPGETNPNQVTVALGANKRVSLYNHNGSIHLIADLAGHYATDRGNPFYQLTPLRLFDTRDGFGPIGPNEYLIMPLEGFLPSAASTLVFNLTGTGPTSSTFLTAWPDEQELPNASNLNLVPGQTAANLVTVALGPAPNRSVNVFNRNGSVHMIFDLAGYFAPPPPTCAIGCARTWGDNLYGQLGIGTTGGATSTPSFVNGLSDLTDVTAGALNSYALRTDGTVWSWGPNDLQGLGNGRFYGMSTVPTRVQTLQPINAIASGAYTAYALGSGGVRAWGYNGDGSLGDGTTEPRDLPVWVSGLSSDVVAIAAGYSTGYALKSDGTVWAWGSNGGSLGNGQFGTGCDTVPVGPGCRTTTPIQVPGLRDVVSIAATWNNAFAVKSDGTVWAWGWNAEGELGIGTAGGPACYESIPPTAPNCVAVSPVQVPALTGVTRIVGGGSATAYAITSDGGMLAWGWNSSGELGNGTIGGSQCGVDPGAPTCYSAVPVPVSGLTEVTDAAGGRLFALTRRADGTVWSWGFNRFGQLGLPDPGDTGTPTQVPGLSGASAVGAGGFVSLAVVPNVPNP